MVDAMRQMVQARAVMEIHMKGQKQRAEAFTARKVEVMETKASFLKRLSENPLRTMRELIMEATTEGAQKILKSLLLKGAENLIPLLLDIGVSGGANTVIAGSMFVLKTAIDVATS